jgi:hypothetical protein
MIVTQALYNKLANDATLIALLAEYNGAPAIFTTDPAPDDAVLPYIVAAGNVAAAPFDAKDCLGQTVTRDVRCYAAANGSAAAVETIAELVRALLHRQEFTIVGYNWIMSAATGPISADERFVYGRIVTVSVTAQED